MNVSQALEYERQPFIPMFIYGDHGAMESERQKGEEALKVLETEYFTAEGDPSFDFATVRDLADRNRDLCDQIGEARLRNVTPATPFARPVRCRHLRRHRQDAKAYRCVRHARNPRRPRRARRGVRPQAYPGHGARHRHRDHRTCARARLHYQRGLGDHGAHQRRRPARRRGTLLRPADIYRGEDVPLSNIHHITWDDIDGKEPFRENKELQKQLLKLMKKYPYMAHNAAFEDSWFKIHLDGYAEARRAGKIIVIDSRQICRSLDADVRSLPRESAPAALENWARRRGTLAADANEQHLGLDDTDLMLRTVQAEFNLKNLFAK